MDVIRGNRDVEILRATIKVTSIMSVHQVEPRDVVISLEVNDGIPQLPLRRQPEIPVIGDPESPPTPPVMF